MLPWLSLSGLVTDPVATVRDALDDVLQDVREDAGELARRGAAVTRPVGRVLAGLPADLAAELARAAAALADAGAGRSRRRVWSRPGRAHIEVRGLAGHGDLHDRLRRELTAALRAVEGVNWAEVNAALGQIVVDVDEDRIGADDLVGLVEAVEAAHGSADRAFAGGRPPAPWDPTPGALAKASLVADCAGLAVAAVRRLTRVPAFPAALRVPVVVAETHPRLRRVLEERLGREHADTALGLVSAFACALTDGVAPVALDALQRVLQLGEIRARRQVWEAREHKLIRDEDGLLPRVEPPAARPEPLPAGPVEKAGNRVALAQLLGAGGLLAFTRNPGAAARAVLATVPKAAGMGREAYCAQLGRALARDGVVAMDATALRRLDRVTTVLVDSAALCAARPRLLSVLPVGDVGEADLWEVAHAALAGRSVDDLGGDGPWTSGQWRLERPADSPHGRPDAPGGLALDIGDGEGRRQGRVVVGCDLDPLADAVVAAARTGGRRVLLTEHLSVTELLPWADEVLPPSAAPAGEVRRLQADGQVVLVVGATDDHALALADVGVAVIPARAAAGRVCWSADLLCGPGLAQVWRVLAAVADARRVSVRSAHLALGGASLGALVAAAGTRRGIAGPITSPVHGAAFLAQLGGVAAARRSARRTPPPGRVRGAWHAHGARETCALLRDLAHQATDEVPAAASARPLPSWAAAAVGALPLAARLRPAAEASAQLLVAVREELRDPLTPVLALGAAASAALGSGVDSALVGGVMAGNAVVSGAQRVRAERALRGLLLTQRRTARRLSWTPPDPADAPDREAFFAGLDDAPRDTVPADDLRVGDVIELRPSDVVPADARLLVADRLEIEEASLTGEAAPVTKDPRATPGAELADRTCMVYQGCTVLAGTGHAIVVATGAASEEGRAADLAGAATVPGGLEKHLAALTRTALPAVGLGGAVVTLVGLLRGVPVREALASGVAIAVAAVPEGLPLVATAAQSAAARRLSRHGILTRTARVLEALGRVDVVCFDKTGTLTEGRLAVARVTSPEEDLPPDGEAGRRVLRVAARACPGPGDGTRLAHATDRAVVDAAAQGPDDDAWSLVSELPFEASRGYSASLGTENGEPRLAVKGAPETVLARCVNVTSGPDCDAGDGTAPLDDRGTEAANALVRRLAGHGLRVLAVAEARPADAPENDADVAEAVRDLTLLGFVAIADTPRPGADETVRRLAEAGVRVTMITGDHPATASAVARDLAIPGAGEVLTGRELDVLPERARLAKVARTTVFARVSPEHKVRIVQDLRRLGHVVAMTGDGVNDAAAIRLADVGIGLSARGGLSAGAAADLVLTEPDPARILHALLEGRTLWRSVRDAVGILVGGNAGEVAFTVIGTILSGRAPLGTRQLLLVNLLTDMLPALAVALAPAREPRPGEDPLADGPAPALLGRDLTRVLAVRGTATALGATAAWQIGRMTGRGRRASTMGLAALVGTQLGQTLITDRHSPLVLATVAVSVGALFAVVQIPGLSHFFGCTPLGPAGWGTVAACSVVTTVAAALAGRVSAGTARA